MYNNLWTNPLHGHGRLGYGYLGQNGDTPPQATSSADIEASYRVGLQVGVPIATGLLGVGVGLVLGSGLGDLAEAEFALIGEGPLSKPVAMRVQALGLDGQVHLLGWHHQAFKLMVATDVVSLTSRWEGSPYALLEAMAWSRPVVATAVLAAPAGNAEASTATENVRMKTRRTGVFAVVRICNLPRLVRSPGAKRPLHCSVRPRLTANAWTETSGDGGVDRRSTRC